MTPVALVHVDEASIERLGDPPWPADVHATIVKKLTAAGARVIAFTAPVTAQNEERIRAALRLIESSGTDLADERRRLRVLLANAGSRNDLAVLAKAMKDSGRVVIPLPVGHGDSVVHDDIVPGDARIVVSPALLHSARPLSSIDPPASVLTQASAAAGHTALIADVDGIVRRDFTAIRVGTALVPSLATAIALTALAVPFDKLQFVDEKTLALGSYRFQLQPELSSLIHPLRAADVTTLSYHQVLDADGASLASLRDAIVLVQPTRAASVAAVNTALGTQDAALVTAAAAVSLIDGIALEHSAVSTVVEWSVALLVIALATFALPRLGPTMGAVVVVLTAIALFILEFVVLSATGVWLQLVVPMLALAAGLVASILVRFVHVGGRRATEDAASLRSLGQTFRRQGQLDLAFETFRRCPLDTVTMDMLYALGCDYERRHQYSKALAVYSYMGSHDAGYRDLRARRAQVIRRGAEYQKRLSPQTPAQPQPVIEPSPLDPAVPTWPPAPARTLGCPAGIRTLGRYEIEREIGKGAMGVVYLGRDPKINRVVAIKAIPLAKEFEEEDLAEARARFFREAEMAGRLNHPAIVTVYDAGEDQGLAYIAMEYLRGQHLSHFAESGRLLPPRTVMLLAARVADALHYAHRQNVVHRDIKPANIMFDPDTDELKITDFGIARLTDASRTKTGIVLGTPSFMSPEQLEGRSLDGRSDLFALGVSLYQLLTGQLPFRADSMPRLMQKIATEPHSPINLVRPDLPPCIVGIVDKVLAKSPEDRYQNGAELAAALRACAQSEDAQW